MTQNERLERASNCAVLLRFSRVGKAIAVPLCVTTHLDCRHDPGGDAQHGGRRRADPVSAGARPSHRATDRAARKPRHPAVSGRMRCSASTVDILRLGWPGLLFAHSDLACRATGSSSWPRASRRRSLFREFPRILAGRGDPMSMSSVNQERTMQLMKPIRTVPRGLPFVPLIAAENCGFIRRNCRREAFESTG